MIDTKELRRLLAEATPGKLVIKIEHVGLLRKDSVLIYDEYNRIVAIVGLAKAKANAALIVALRNAAPELLDRLEKAEELLRDTLDHTEGDMYDDTIAFLAQKETPQ